MKLADYLSKQNIPGAEFARRIEVSQEAVRRYVKGDRRPEWDVLARIVSATDGHVQPNDFLKLSDTVV